ncbi:transposase [Ancylobacter aquaticus]|uniref:transposase n=1 Tax=Ancylobacter aquaticus TaxID=100 RepID=UPI003CCB1AB1
MRRDRRQGEALSDQSIEGNWSYLWIDASYLEIGAAAGSSPSPLSSPSGSTPRGGAGRGAGARDRDLKAGSVWTEFLRKLTRRGLRGVNLVVSDAHEGIKAAVSKVSAPSGRASGAHPA